MRHPLLRILVALLVGVVTPLCCCQAAALAGSACNGRHVAKAASDSCCGGCSKKRATPPASDRPHQNPSDDEPAPGGKCPSCPSCRGALSGAGIIAEPRLPVFEQQWCAPATFALAALRMFDASEVALVPYPPVWALGPPYVKANRDAQRWYCALLA